MTTLLSDHELFPVKVNTEALVEAIFNKLPDLVFIFDMRDKKFVIRNPALDDVMGFSTLSGDDITCISLKSIIHPSDWHTVQQAIKLAVKLPDQEFIEIETRCRDQRQQYLHFHTRLSVFERDGDNVLYLLGIAQNITARKKSDHQKEMYKNRLQELSFITSHEMRHEYAKIQSIVNLMDNRFITDNERVDLISEAKKSIQLINSSIFRLNHKLSFNQHDDFFDMNKEVEKFKKVVFIDDDVLTNVLNKKIVQALLPEMPTEVFLDVDEAMDELRKEPAIQDVLIFLDINFPGRGGWDFLDNYIRFSSAANIIVLSSSIDNRDREKARSYKAVIDYITKPLSFDFIKTFFEELQAVQSA